VGVDLVGEQQAHMRATKVAEKVARLGFLLSAACATDHRVSPWGERPPPIGVLLRQPDLGRRLAEIDAETAGLGLGLTVELGATLPAARGTAVVRGYEGADSLGRRVTAVRAATPRGVVLALGPLDPRDLARDAATELVPSLAPVEGGDANQGAWRSGTDLNGDGLPDVVARGESGALEVWSLDLFGANRYPVELEATPTSALDVDGDGRPDLSGRVAVPEGDPLAPELDDVATADERGWSHASAGARAFHDAHARRLAPPPPPPPPEPEHKPAPAGDKPPPDASTSAKKPPPAPPDDARLRRALERAWHRLLSGEPREGVLADLDRERVPPALRASFEAWRRRVERARAGDGARTR
jgi:hypothetical protein